MQHARKTPDDRAFCGIMDALTSWLLEGEAALERGDTARAIESFRQARDAAPHVIPIALLLANAHRIAGDTPRARDVLRAVHAASPPANAAEQHALGAALLDVGAPKEAAECFAYVMRIHPRDPAALTAMASAKRAMGQPGVAWPLVQRALAIAPSNPAFLLTAAQVRHALGDLAGARRWLAAADRLRPNHPPTRLQCAYTSLLRGPSADGWQLFESRALPVPATKARAWHGESLHGESILVAAEQGMGDLLQFVRFVPELAARGATRVVVECHAGLVSLLTASGIEAVPRGAVPETDWYVPMLSLPNRLGLATDVGASRVPYLVPEVAARASHEREVRRTERREQQQVKGVAPRRLGVVWLGNPAFLATTLRDFDETLLPELLTIPDIEWISLQFGEASPTDYAGLARPTLTERWLETAQLLARLDGLVTVDTGMAHLAGAMGVPTWVLLPAAPDWRWGLGADTTPWYPSHRLLRQKSPNDWRSVVKALREALAER